MCLRNSLSNRESLGRDVIYLEVSGHYVQVTTTVGSAVTLMRFADAVDAPEGLVMRIHHSYRGPPVATWRTWCGVTNTGAPCSADR